MIFSNSVKGFTNKTFLYPFSFNTCFILPFSFLKSSLFVIMKYALLNKEWRKQHFPCILLGDKSCSVGIVSVRRLPIYQYKDLSIIQFQ